ncbi:MAG: acyclic terpene utilization AtuA family protein [Solirubrobacterales bacterium]|nr:acyclic terpene utilization AtuA family protein [Solirubrobacterales bacterium]
MRRQLRGARGRGAVGRRAGSHRLPDRPHRARRRREISKPAGSGGRIDELTCVLQLLYEVHDPSAYVTPDAVLDLSGIELAELGADRVGVRGARHAGRPERLKASGYALRPGVVMDAEIAFAGPGALGRSRTAAEVLEIRLAELGVAEALVDTVGVDSVLGPASAPAACEPPEVRVHASVGCDDDELAQAIEDELYALTLAGPAGGCALRSEARPRFAVLDGRVDRDRVSVELEWEVAR